MSSEIDHLSISQINEFLGCSQHYFYHRIAEFDPCDVSSSLVIGSAFHSAIEHFNVMKIDGIEVGLSELNSVFQQCLLNDENEKVVNWGKTSREEVFREGEPWLEAFVNSQNPDENVLIAEEAFEMNLPGIPVPVIGRVDAVLEDKNGDICVIDYKTAGARPSATDLSQNLQMTLYGIWAKQRFPNSEIKLRLDYLIKSKREPFLQKYEINRTEIQEQALSLLFKKVYNHISMLRADVIEPLPVASWKCTGCGYRNLCIQQVTAA